MPIDRHPKVLKAIRVLSKGTGVAVVSACLSAVFATLAAFLNLNSFIPAMLFTFAGIFALLLFSCFVISGILIAIFYLRYSLKELLGFFFLSNVCLACIVSKYPILVVLGVLFFLALGALLTFHVLAFDPMLAAADFPKYVKSASNGVVKRILVKHGEAVVTGQKLLVLQSNEYEFAIDSDYNATVESIDVRLGQSVAAGMVLGVLKTG